MGMMEMCLADKNIERESRHFEGSTPELALIDGRYKVEWINLGEGRDGDYDPNDSSDIELLRFDIYFDGELIQDGSYCTLMPTDTQENILRKGLERIMDTINDECSGGNCSRKVFEELSWIGPKWFQELESKEEKKSV
jgi:hypothetical protein